MSHPLPDYFISSSHNTYLVGEQWRGESTAEGYIRVLLAKCRCVESAFLNQNVSHGSSVDVHDGDVEPVVHHRKTLTSSVPVRDICRAISKYAFVSSSYPVIISAEVRCSAVQQFRLGVILRDTFGDALVTAPLDCRSELPSPTELKFRILFKVPTNQERDR